MDPYQNLERVLFYMIQHVLNYLYTKFQASTPMFLEFGDLGGCGWVLGGFEFTYDSKWLYMTQSMLINHTYMRHLHISSNFALIGFGWL